MWWSKWNRQKEGNELFPYLSAETTESQQALTGSEILIPALPFRVGRESRQLSAIASTYLSSEDRRQIHEQSNNELYLVEVGELRFISREHFLIGRDFEGRYFVEDRGSTLGTLVGNTQIGGNGKKGKAYLQSGDLIIPGGKRSPFVFRFQLVAEKKYSLRVNLDRTSEMPNPVPPDASSPVGRMSFFRTMRICSACKDWGHYHS